MTAEASRRIKLLLLGAVIGISFAWAAFLTTWLTPAPSDMRLSFSQTSSAENSKLPQKALDNHMPQLGMWTFWLDGKLMQSFGHLAPYGVRYFLFVISFVLMLLLYLRIHRPADEDIITWSLFFLLTVAGTFFFSIKFFFWLDYLVVIPLSLLAIVLIKRNAPAWQLFLLTLIVMSVKMSGFYILITFIGVFLKPDDLKRHWKTMALAVFLSVVYFFAKWGLASIADRGHSGIQNFSQYSLMGLNLLTRPWLIFTFFDKAHQKIITDLDLLLLLKALLFAGAIAWLALKKTPGLFFSIACFFIAFICSLVIIRDHPTLHDFAAYNGIIELGLISLFWMVFRLAENGAKKIILAAAGVLFLLQLGLWSASYRDLEPTTSKASLVNKLEKETNNRKHFYLFCSWNVGEFEYFLDNVTVHYSLWTEPFGQDRLRETRPALLLVPRSCLHEAVTADMRSKYKSIIDQNGLRFMETVKIDKNQVYDLYEAP